MLRVESPALVLKESPRFVSIHVPPFHPLMKQSAPWCSGMHLQTGDGNFCASAAPDPGLGSWSLTKNLMLAASWLQGRCFQSLSWVRAWMRAFRDVWLVRRSLKLVLDIWPLCILHCFSKAEIEYTGRLRELGGTWRNSKTKMKKE